MKSAGQTKRYDYIDFMNILACFCVVALHCSGVVFSFSETRTWWIAMTIQSVAHFAVPVFFMITGITLLEYRKKYDTAVFYKKRILKTAIPFLFWSIFYIFFHSWLNQSPLPSVGEGIKMILANQVLGIFWFFYEIFGVYLIMPILSLLARKENLKEIRLFCVLFFLYRAVLPLVNRYIAPVTGGLMPSLVGGCTGYLFLGYLIQQETYNRRQRIGIYTAGAAGCLLMLLGTFVLSKQTGNLDKIFMDYYSIACMPYSFAVMLFAKNFPWKKVYAFIPQSAIQKLSGASLGVYVLHMVFLELQGHVPLFNTMRTAYEMVILPPIIYFLCVCVILILKKIAGIKYLIP